jgi:phosphatidylserine decarboxylase
LLLSSAFHMSVENAWKHMNSLTNGTCMTHVQFKLIVDYLRGFNTHS